MQWGVRGRTPGKSTGFYVVGGGVVTLFFFVKLDLEIAVDQQTKAHDQTFEGVPGARGTATPLFGQFLAQFCQITFTFSKQFWGALLVATSLLTSSYNWRPNSEI